MASKRDSKNHTTDSTRALEMCLDSTNINLHPVDECISLMMLSKANLQVNYTKHTCIYTINKLYMLVTWHISSYGKYNAYIVYMLV